MFSVEMLPARNGDALWIEYGPDNAPHRLLIDGGTAGTFRELARRCRDSHLELVVVTHVDADHIGGALRLLTDDVPGFTVRDVWFNGYRHLPRSPLESLGPVQGETLTLRLAEPDLSWNGDFDGRAVVVSSDAPLPTKSLPGGLELTLLSPGPDELSRLRPVWEREVRRAGLDPATPPAEESAPVGLERLGAAPTPDVDALAATESEEDGSEANGSSIALLAEHDGRRLLLAADAHPGVLLRALDRLVGADAPLEVDLFKMPHHGARSNVTGELMRRVRTRRYLFSSNGARHHHPHPEAVAKAIRAGGRGTDLYFNYRTPFNAIWDDAALSETHGYTAHFAADGRRVSL